jgi:hypothetical protein
LCCFKSFVPEWNKKEVDEAKAEVEIFTEELKETHDAQVN